MAKTKALISCAVTAQLIRAFAFAKIRVSHLHFVWEFKDGINSSLSDFYVIIYNCVHEVKTLKYSFESLVTSLKLYILKQENTQPEKKKQHYYRIWHRFNGIS